MDKDMPAEAHKESKTSRDRRGIQWAKGVYIFGFAECDIFSFSMENENVWSGMKICS